MIIKVPYYISNNGDGSASLNLCATLAEAEKEDDAQPEGWGESSAGIMELCVDESGQVSFEEYNTINGKFQKVRIIVEQ